MPTSQSNLLHTFMPNRIDALPALVVVVVVVVMVVCGAP
jgi:hypothetical protein